MTRMRVLVLAPNINIDGVGEGYRTAKMIEALSDEMDITLMTLQSVRQRPVAETLPQAEVVAWTEPAWLGRRRTRRLHALAKPALPLYFGQVRRWIRRRLKAGDRWEIAHQMLPQAMRYASPLRGLGLPYAIGPLGGSLETPPAFRAEVGEGGLTARLRRLDRWRLAHEPGLRAGYGGADLILGAAPYVEETLRMAGLAPARFATFLERGQDGPLRRISTATEPGVAKLLHVGRGVRTKGLRDVIRALAELRDLPGVTLTSAGEGPEIDACRAEAARLGVADRVSFLGQLPRAEIDPLYEEADIFAFPSFREPMGGVFFEAMAFGLPVITAARGGPDVIVDESCGIRLPVDTPESFATAIAGEIRRLAMDPGLRRRLGEGAQARLASFGDWDDKARQLTGLYREVLDGRRAVAA